METGPQLSLGGHYRRGVYRLPDNTTFIGNSLINKVLRPVGCCSRVSAFEFLNNSQSCRVYQQ